MKRILIVVLLVLLPSVLFSNNKKSLEESENYQSDKNYNTPKSENNIIVYTTYKYNAIPDFMLKPFFDEFQSVNGHSFSIQTSFKTGNFAYTIDLDFMNLSAKDGYWAQKDKAPDYFILDTTYLNLGINFEWFFTLSPKLQMISSIGLGFGTFLGEMTKYKTAGISNDPTNSVYKKEDLKPPFFGHILIAMAAQYEVYKVKGKSPVYLRVNMGFKNSLFIGTSLGYQF